MAKTQDELLCCSLEPPTEEDLKPIEDEDDEFASTVIEREQDYWDSAWEYVHDSLTDLIKETNPDGKWHCEVTGFGWRNRNGEKDFEATDGKKLLREILPDTQCYFRVYRDEYNPKAIRINVTHHDSPMWDKEWYALTSAVEEEEE